MPDSYDVWPDRVLDTENPPGTSVRRPSKQNIAPKQLPSKKVALVGDENTGKSSFCQLMECWNEKSNVKNSFPRVSSSSEPTTGVDLRRFYWEHSSNLNKKAFFNVYDLSGKKCFGEIRHDFYKETLDMIVFFASCVDKGTQLNLDKWYKEVMAAGAAQTPKMCVVFVRQEAAPIPNFGKEWAATKNMNHFILSLRDCATVSTFLDHIVNELT